MPTERPYQFVPVDVPVSWGARVGRLFGRRPRLLRLLGQVGFVALLVYLFVSGWLLVVVVGAIILSLFGVRFGMRQNSHGQWTARD